MFAKGTQVQQVMPAPIAGTVAGYSIDQQTGASLILVEWPDADGSTHSRYFTESELQAAPTA